MANTLQHRTGVLRRAALRSLRRLTGYIAALVLLLLLVVGAAVAVTQTNWFKNWLRQKAVSQAAQYLNGELTIRRLGGNLFTGVELDAVELHAEGRTAVAIRRLTVEYSPLTMISQGIVLSSMTLESPTVLLERDERGWNVSRFVKPRKPGGRGAPPITIESIVVNNGHLIVRDHGRPVDDLTALHTRLRFAYEKPGIAVSIRELSGKGSAFDIDRLAGDLRFDRGAIVARNLSIQTDRSKLLLSAAYSGPARKHLDIVLDAERLSLPELGHYFKPVAEIRLEPSIDLTAQGTLDALKMQVDVASSAGSARGPLVGHFGAGKRHVEGRLDVRNIDMASLLNRKEWKTRVTGQAQFDWRFSPARIDFTFGGPQVEGFGYRAGNVKARGVYRPEQLRVDASGSAYGATATTRASFHFATRSRPLAYTLEGTFRNLDLRRLPDRLAMPKLESQVAGSYRFEASGATWSGSGDLEASTVEGAEFGAGTLVAIESRNRELSYSASGSVAWLDPRRFAAPLNMKWLDDERLSGLLTGTFNFEGSGRTMDDLVLRTSASLVDSTLAGARFPGADVEFSMADRKIQAHFTGTYEQLQGALLTERKELADTTLNGTADMAVRIDLPATGPAQVLEVAGSTTLAPSTIAGLKIDSGDVAGSFADRMVDIKELVLTGPDATAKAAGVFAFGDTGESKLAFDVAVTNLEPLAKRFDRPVAGSAHIVGEATGPASDLTIAGTLGANRLRYGTNFDALTAKSQYTVRLPDFDIERARIEADTGATFVTIAGRHLPRVSAKTVYEKEQLVFDAMFEEDTRSLGLGGSVIFHPDHDEVHLRALNLTVGKTQWTLPPGQEATARYSDNSVTLDSFILERGEQRLTAAGTVSIGAGSANLANNLVVRLDNVQVQDVNELLLGDRPLTGVLNASAEIRGTRNNPVVQADFSITDGSADGVKFIALTGTANYSDRAVDVDARLEQTPQAVLTAVGTVPVPTGPGTRTRATEIDLAVKSSPIDLGLLQPATTQVSNLRGQFTADVRVQGPLDAPRVSGLVETTNGGFTVVSTGVSYTNTLARILFDNDRLFVDRFEVVDEDGHRLVALGEVGIVNRGVGAMNLQVSASGFKVLNNEFGNVEVDTDLRITGDASKPIVTGVIRTDAGRLEVDQILEQLARSPYRTAPIVATEAAGAPPAAPAAEPVASRLGIYNAATIDVRVNLPDDLLLRGRDMHAGFSRIGLGDMNITVGGELQIRKAPGGEPDLIGTVTVVRGFYDFQGRRFEVLRDSQIRFQGAHPIDPALQVNAERMISGVTAIINIRGTARQPVVRLSSQPPLDEADVLSLILFDQPINQLGEGERVRLAERAGALAVGYLSSPLANSIARALDLDMFEIRAVGAESGRPSIALSEQFGSRLFVSFRQEFGADDYTQLSLEYRISEVLRLVSTVTQGYVRTHRTQRIDTTGVDLIYTISY